MKLEKKEVTNKKEVKENPLLDKVLNSFFVNKESAKDPKDSDTKTKGEGDTTTVDYY